MIGVENPLSDYLEPGETVLWTDRPAFGGFLRRNCLSSVFGLLSLGFVFLWVLIPTGWRGVSPDVGDGPASALRAILSDTPTIFLLAGSVILIVGLYRTFGHYVASVLAWRRARYAITDRRVLILEGALRPSLVSLPLRDIPAVQVVERGGGTADLILGPYEPRGTMRWYRSRYAAYQPQSPTLFAVPDARRAYQVLQGALSAARGAGGT